jgi:hypothetical protein
MFSNNLFRVEEKQGAVWQFNSVKRLDYFEDANANLFATDIRGPEVWRSDDAGATWRRTHEQPLREFWYTYGYYFAQI